MRRLHVCRRSLFLTQKRSSSVVAAESKNYDIDEHNPLYPPIKPKFPPGKWGAMEPSYAWLWHKSREESLAIPNVLDRISKYCEKEIKRIEISVKDATPRSLEYKKYITKTHVKSGLPDVYQNESALLDELTAQMSSIVCDTIVAEAEQFQRSKHLKQFGKFGNGHESARADLLLSSIIFTLTSHLSGQIPHLQQIQYDEKVSLAATWERHGFERSTKIMIHPDKYKWGTVYDNKVNSATTADIILRTDKPLPEFMSRDEEPSVGAEVPVIDMAPHVFGQRTTPGLKGSVDAGYKWGDPCEFGLMSLLNTAWTKKPAEKYGTTHAYEARLCQGIMTSFVWLAAQAHNQGFNSLVDLTYPLTTQTVLTDGQRWQFLAYQLNTLELWKDNQANSRANLCWLGEEQNLYAEVSGGKVHGFNPEVLRQLIGFLALAPADRPYNLRPTLPDRSENPKQRREYIPRKKEEVIVVEEEKYVIE